jgi:tight adherence protein C
VRAGEPATLNGFLMAAALAGAAGGGFGFTLALASHSAGSRVLLFVMFGMVIGLYLPRMWLAGRVRVRQKLILKSLPDAFDLITVCVEAGLGLEAALARVSEKVQGPFGEELSVTLREVAMGKLRRDALRELADRTGVPDLTSFISAVVQAETLGTSIATVLRVQAEQMRMRRRQRAERQAQQAPVKMIFPLVLCIFPTMFIVILGPAGLRIMDELGGK